MVKVLLDCGASPSKASQDGLTLYHFAASNNDVLMLDYAIRHPLHFNIDV
jgi:hypothetical protein